MMWRNTLMFVLLVFINVSTKTKDTAYQLTVIIQLENGKDPLSLPLDIRADRNYHSLSLNYQKTLSSRQGIYSYELQTGDIDRAIPLLHDHSWIKTVQRDEKVEFRKTPNDENFPLQWGLEYIGLHEFWEVETGGRTANGDTIVVAVLDQGFDIDHEDLSGNIWTNHLEIPGDDIDNDANGYVDDYHGWNFLDDGPRHSISQHGQSVAGIIGAKGNNGIGVTGINWNIKLMLFTIESVSDIIAAYDYIIEQRNRYNTSFGEEGAFVVATNASFGSNGQFCEEQPIWGAMYDQLGSAGVLTGAGTANGNWDVDLVGDMPTTCSSDFIITTLNINQEGRKHPGSAFGKVSIDIGSPGENSFTTKPFGLYGAFGKNSAAAPHLTGAIALLYAAPCKQLAKDALVSPRETALYVRNIILEGVQRQEDLKDKTVTGGSLHVANSLELLSSDCTTTIGELKIRTLFPNPATSEVSFDYQAAGFDKHTLRIVNVLGQLVYVSSFTPPMFGRKRVTVELPFRTPGAYFLILQRGQELVAEKFIVQ